MLRAGHGKPLLFLHGSRGLEGPTPFFGALAELFDCIAPEHPGFGGGELPAWLDNVADLAHFYFEFIADQGLRDVHLVGYDLGGWIAAEMAVRNSSALASLTLIGAQGIHVPGVPTADTFLLSNEQLLRDTFHDEGAASAWAAREKETLDDTAQLVNKQAAARLTWNPRGHDPHLGKWLHRIDVPTLVVWGDEDKLLPREYGRSWQQRVPRAQLASIAGCGHAPHLEKHGEVVAAFERFTSSIGSAA